ncbi:MAG: hypothetical protein ACJAYV_002066 [Oleispira sp.]|jgi:hypothetical protein
MYYGLLAGDMISDCSADLPAVIANFYYNRMLSPLSMSAGT